MRKKSLRRIGFIYRTGPYILLLILGIVTMVGILSLDVVALNENLTVTADPNTVYTNESTNVTITVTCTISDLAENCMAGDPVNRANVALSGAFTFNGVTNTNGQLAIQVLPTSIGDIIIAAKHGKDTGNTKITSKKNSVTSPQQQLEIIANKKSIYMDTSTDVTFSVKEICVAGTTIGCNEAPVANAKITLDTGQSGITDNSGQFATTIDPISQGTITAQVSKTGYIDGNTTISVITIDSGSQLNISTDTSGVNVGIPKSVTYYVSRQCGSIPGDICAAPNSSIPVEDANITISGVASGSGVTNSNGKDTIVINAESPGVITAIASKQGYIDASNNLDAKLAINFAPGRDKYYRGETVNLILSNNGGVPIQLGSWFIKNDSSGDIVHLSSPIGSDYLNPNQSITLDWDQTNNSDINNSQCEPGPYRAVAGYSQNGINYTLDARFDLSRCTRIVNDVQQISSNVGQDVNFPIDLSNTSRKWNTTTWYINGVEAYNQTGIKQISSYLNDSAAQGEWNVTAIALDGCSSISWSWIWTVDKPSCVNIQNYRNMSTYAGDATTFKSGNLSDISDSWNFTWYVDNKEVFNETGVSQSTYVSNSNSIGTLNVTVSATKDCNIVNWTWSWTVTQKPTRSGNSGSSSSSSSSGGSNGGGGGGGGGGIVSAEPFSNILKFERQDASLVDGVPVPYNFSSPELSIYQVLITGSSNEDAVGMRVEHLKNTSVLANRNPSGVVYANENVWLESKRYKNVILRFKVKNSWLADNNIAKETIQLLRFNDGWKKSPTNITKIDNEFIYFEAKSSDLSPFAISGKEQVNVNTNSTEALPTQSSPKVVTVNPIKKSPGFESIFTMISIFVICIFRKRYSKKKE